MFLKQGYIKLIKSDRHLWCYKRFIIQINTVIFWDLSIHQKQSRNMYNGFHQKISSTTYTTLIIIRNVLDTIVTICLCNHVCYCCFNCCDKNIFLANNTISIAWTNTFMLAKQSIFTEKNKINKKQNNQKSYCMKLPYFFSTIYLCSVYFTVDQIKSAWESIRTTFKNIWMVMSILFSVQSFENQLLQFLINTYSKESSVQEMLTLCTLMYCDFFHALKIGQIKMFLTFSKVTPDKTSLTLLKERTRKPI